MRCRSLRIFRCLRWWPAPGAPFVVEGFRPWTGPGYRRPQQRGGRKIGSKPVR